MPFFYMCPSLQTGAVQPQTPEPLQEDLPVEELHDQETLEPASTPQPKSVPSNDTFTSNSGGKQKKIARKSTPPQAFTSSGKKPFKPIRKKGKKVSLTPVSQPKGNQKRTLRSSATASTTASDAKSNSPSKRSACGSRTLLLGL